MKLVDVAFIAALVMIVMVATVARDKEYYPCCAPTQESTKCEY
jgi:hypothetical protein